MKKHMILPIFALSGLINACGQDTSGSDTLAVTGAGAKKDADEHVVHVVTLREARSTGSAFKPTHIRLDHQTPDLIDGPRGLQTTAADPAVAWFVKPGKGFLLKGAVGPFSREAQPNFVPEGGFALDVEAPKKGEKPQAQHLGFDGKNFFKRGFGVILTPAQRQKISNFSIRFDRLDTEKEKNLKEPLCGTGELNTVSIRENGSGVLTTNTCLDIPVNDLSEDQKERHIQKFNIPAEEVRTLLLTLSQAEIKKGKGHCETASTSSTELGTTTTVSWQVARYVNIVHNGQPYRYAREGGACDGSWFEGVFSGSSYWSLRQDLLDLAKDEKRVDNLEARLAGLWARVDRVCASPFVKSSVKVLEAFAGTALDKLCQDAKAQVTKAGGQSSQE